MENYSNETEEIKLIIQKLIKFFEKPEENSLKEDMDKAKNLKEENTFINEFLIKYSNSDIDNQTSQQMIYDIISELIFIRKDFVPFMKIYMITIDEIKADILRKEFILKEKSLNLIENNDLNNKNKNIKLRLSLSYLFDEEIYYERFVKKILFYLREIFNENYLNEYIEYDFYKYIDKSKYYKENKLSLVNSLIPMLININEVLNEHSEKDLNKDSNIVEIKMPLKRFRILLIKSNLSKNEEMKNIYDKCKDNDEILKKINNLLDNYKDDTEEELYFNIIILKEEIEKYIKEKNDYKHLKEREKSSFIYDLEIHFAMSQMNDLPKLNNKLSELEKDINELKKQQNNMKMEVEEIKKKINEQEKIINEHEKIINEHEKILNGHEKKLNEHEQIINEHGKEINEQESKINNIGNEIKQLKERVDFLEPIVLYLIIDKIINYCIIKILEKYKNNIKITSENKNNKIIYKISFKDSINNITKDDLNNLIEKLLNKKDEFKENSCLINKDDPPFIPDIWPKVKQYLKLNTTQSISFDALITNEIKASFDLRNDELSVTNYLKNANVYDFGN